MSEWIYLKHNVSGNVWRCVNDPDVISDQATRGWRLISDEEATAPADPSIYGTYDAVTVSAISAISEDED